MSGERDVVLPQQLAFELEMTVDKLIDNAAKYDNVSLLDESQVYALHLFAASVYAAGHRDGQLVAQTRVSSARSREHDQRRRDEAKLTGGAL